MSTDPAGPKRRSLKERILALFGFTFIIPTRPHEVGVPRGAPDGLAFVCSAPSVPEADLMRQVLGDAGFHVEFVPSITTGLFGTTGSVHIYVKAGQEQEAREFLAEMQEATLPGEDEPSE